MILSISFLGFSVPGGVPGWVCWICVSVIYSIFHHARLVWYGVILSQILCMCHMCDSGPPQEFGELYGQEYGVGEFNLYAIHSLCNSVFMKVSRVSVFRILSLVCDTILLGLRLWTLCPSRSILCMGFYPMLSSMSYDCLWLLHCLVFFFYFIFIRNLTILYCAASSTIKR
jgi:hypothetical protein